MQRREGRHISIGGVVQGVGFRPFVYNLAARRELNGWVLNHSGGVEIESECGAEVLDTFIDDLARQAPPLAQIESLTAVPCPTRGYSNFEIRESERHDGSYQLISPDVATCPDCRREVLDPTNRRHRYPFTNCTNCGPRFTIIADIPYDRPNTTMNIFPMCPDCQREYDDPANRRFHAQPNACPVCGPHIWLTDSAGRPLAGDEGHADNDVVLAQTRDLLLAGKIVAIKGLGGFHLACDATNLEAVSLLRQRKRRPSKPFAVMAAHLDDVKRHCRVSNAEESLLTSTQCPIVLLERLTQSPIVDEVAPRNGTLGMMLPYTPLHHLMLWDVGRPLVMTSGNLSEEPIASDNAEALRRLGPLADAFLLHNRDIYSRYDDSVWQVQRIECEEDGKDEEIAQPIRRARGYAPFPIRLPLRVDRPILATGPALKNTFCLARDEYAFISQHIGDMENLETLEHFEATLELYQHLFRLKPAYVVADLHPDYLTSRFAREYAEQAGIPLLKPVQHHQAHVASCIADNNWMLEDGPVIGVALDGTGYGEDDNIWGGEWFVGDYGGFRRVAHLEYLPLPGGDAAIRRPWRIALSYLYHLLGVEAIPDRLGPASEANLLCRQIGHRVNTPFTSSMGRLFDAASALLGVCAEATYEAQAAIELEQIAERPADEDNLRPYPFNQESVEGVLQIRVRPLFRELLEEMKRGTSIPTIAWRFHRTVAEMILQVCHRLRDETGVNAVALSGGCFQSRLLTGLIVPALRKWEFQVLLHKQVPCNDGGLALGQAILAHVQMSNTE